MDFIKVDGHRFFEIEYKPFIANNLAEHGCVIFDCNKYEGFDFNNLTFHPLIKKIEELFVFSINVYDKKNKQVQKYQVFVNGTKISSFYFFDLVSFACGQLGLNSFYALDFDSDKIFSASPYTLSQYGSLNSFPKMLNLNADRAMIAQFLKWASPPGYSRFFSYPHAFRNATEKLYNDLYFSKRLPCQTYFSLDECRDKLDTSTNCLKFDDRTILEFDIDDQSLTIEANDLKARNLTIYALRSPAEVFCNNLKCDIIDVEKLYAESVECKKINAKIVKTNFEHGIKFN